MITILIGGLGLVLGSFVNALVWRIHEQSQFRHKHIGVVKSRVNRKSNQTLSIISGRSMCTTCRHELSAKDLIPVLSWLLLHGRCRYCHAPISKQYPIVELMTALLFVLSYVLWPYGRGVESSVQLVFWLIFLTAFVSLAVYDLKWYILPDRIIVPLIVLAIVELLIRLLIFHDGWPLIGAAFWGVICIAGLFFIVHTVSSGTWIGFGDVKLAVVLGLLVGGPMTVFALIFIASLIGCAIAIPLLLSHRATGATKLPFGPFLLAATFIVVLFGKVLLSFYANLIMPR